MIESIQSRDYALLKLKEAMAFKLYNKSLNRCNDHEENELTIQVMAQIREKNKNKSPAQTYIEKLEKFRASLNEDEIIEGLDFEHCQQDMRKNQLLQDIKDDINELFLDSKNKEIKKSDVINVLVERTTINE